MGKKGVEGMIDEIKIFIDNCKTQALSQTKIVVNKQELLSMLDELEMRLPGEIERCKKIMRNKEIILANARTRSDAMIADAVNQVDHMVEQSEIVRNATNRADEILDNARIQAQQIIDQASEEANEIRLGAMYYTKDKLAEMRDIFTKIHDIEKENYRVLIESLENDTYVVETNMTEMETNINMFTAQSNMSYEPAEDELDSAFADVPMTPVQPKNPAVEQEEEYDDNFEEQQEVDVYGERDEDEDEDDDFDDFLDE